MVLRINLDLIYRLFKIVGGSGAFALPTAGLLQVQQPLF
jgi:hypothetical protein